MSIDLCDTKGFPLSEDQVRKIPRFQRAMRSTVGVVLFVFVVVAITPLSLIYVAGLLPLLLHLRLVKPLPVKLFVDYCCSRWNYTVVYMFEYLFGIKIRSFGYNGQFKQRCLFIMNHVSHLDWMFFWAVVERQGDLMTWRAVAKDMLKKIPIIGQFMQFMMHIFLSRKWEKDRFELSNKIYYLNGLNYPIQLLLFPEGGDLTYKTKKRSDQYADDNGLPRYSYCLHPRTTGFVCLVNALRSGGLDAVYDVTIGYPDVISKTELEFGRGTMPREVHYHIKSYDAKDLPLDDEQLAQWCKDRWREKEDRLKDFYTNREFRESVTGNGPVADMRNGTEKYQRVKEAIGQKQYLSFVSSVLVFTSWNVVIVYLLLYHSWGFVYLGIVLCVTVMYHSYFGEGLDGWLMSFSRKETELAKARAEARSVNAMAQRSSILQNGIMENGIVENGIMANGIVENGTCNVQQEK